MSFGEKLERLIEEMAWSYATAARKAGVSQAVVRRWVNPGMSRFRNNPKPDQLVRLADAFNVDLAWLTDNRLGWEDRPKLSNEALALAKQLTTRDFIGMLARSQMAATTLVAPSPAPTLVVTPSRVHPKRENPGERPGVAKKPRRNANQSS